MVNDLNVDYFKNHQKQLFRDWVFLEKRAASLEILVENFLGAMELVIVTMGRSKFFLWRML